MARAKICGLRTQADVEACQRGGAAFVGFVDFAKSPRHIAVREAAPLLEQAQGMVRVLLTVNASDELLRPWQELGGIDMIQCHGSESPQRLEELRDRSGWQVMKACGVSTRSEVDQAVDTYAEAADYLLFDAKPPQGSDRPGGNAVSFDWSIVNHLDQSTPWMLAGGLTPQNAAQALAISGAQILDISSGVEHERGVKDATKIAEFLNAVAGAG